MTILVIDSSPIWCRLVRDLFGARHTIIERDDGAEAVRAYQLFSPALVLMDIRTRGLGGLEAAQRIKAQWPQARIYIVTQTDDRENREHAALIGVSGYILKDDLAHLQQVVG